MKTSLRCLLAAGLFTSSVVVAQARIERVIEKSFPVTAAGLLRVETHGGAIRVMPSNDSVVRVTARQKINATTEAEADELLKKLELTFDQTGNDVRVFAKYERQPSGFRFRSWPPVHVEFEVTVPSDCVISIDADANRSALNHMRVTFKAEIDPSEALLTHLAA